MTGAFFSDPVLTQVTRHIISCTKYLACACLLATILCGCLAEPHAADAYGVQGVDVSHHQGLIHWQSLAEDNVDFVFMKATEGESLRDKAFLHNWRESGRAGLRRGAYHFFRPEIDPGKQASLFFRTVNLRPGDLPPVLDVEQLGPLSARELVASVTEWLELAELRYGVRPILYTGQHFYNRHLAGRFDEYPLWLARYDREAPVTVCTRAYQFWQYTDRGDVRGIDGRVDRNVFTGSLNELDSLRLPSGGGAVVSSGS